MFARVVVCQSKAGQSGQVGTKFRGGRTTDCRSNQALSTSLRFPTSPNPRDWSASVSGLCEQMPKHIIANTITRSPTC